MKNAGFLPFMIAMMLLATGCGQSPDTGMPPEIRYGQDLCEECGMIITEPRFAAAYYTEEGTAHIFDDIGGMCMFHLQHQENVASFWVHDYETEVWIEAEQAHFVQSSELYTPMAFGVVAFSDLEQAAGLAKETGGMVLTFDQLLAHYETLVTAHQQGNR